MHINMSSHAMIELTQKAQIESNPQNMYYAYSAPFFVHNKKLKELQLY